jgi:essential nuclear protein 1
VHYHEALMRAMYKPAAFFKGIVFPLLDVCVPALPAIFVLTLCDFFRPVAH